MHCYLITKIDAGQTENEATLPGVSMINCRIKSLTRYVEIARMMSSLSVWRMYKFIWKPGTVENFLRVVGIDVGEFLEKRREQKVLKGISFSWQQLLRTELAFQLTFQRCRRHSTKSSWSYRNRLCRKNKHLVEEEQSSEKKSRKSKGN